MLKLEVQEGLRHLDFVLNAFVRPCFFYFFQFNGVKLLLFLRFFILLRLFTLSWLFLDFLLRCLVAAISLYLGLCLIVVLLFVFITVFIIIAQRDLQARLFHEFGLGPLFGDDNGFLVWLVLVYAGSSLLVGEILIGHLWAAHNCLRDKTTLDESLRDWE